MRYLHAYLCVALGILGCSKDNNNNERVVPQVLEEHYFHGDLRQALAEMQHPQSITDACDIKNDPIIEKVIYKIEEHNSEIQKYKSETQGETSTKLEEGEEVEEKIQVGAKFILNKTKMNRTLKSEWSEHSRMTWSELLAKLEANNLSPRELAELEGRVRGYFMSEYNRRYYLKNSYTPRDRWHLMSSLETSLKICLAQENCGLLEWGRLMSDEIKSTFDENPFVGAFLGDVRNSDLDTQRKRLKNLMAFVGYNIDRRKIRRVPNVVHEKTAGQDLYKVHLYSNASPQNKVYFEKELGKFWKDEAQKIAIVWAEKTSSPQPFELFFHEIFGRAFVSWYDATINLYLGDTVSVMLHEFGHVLGLPDRYYEQRDMEKCTYKIQYLETDIMSGNLPGSSWIESDWSDLKATYAIVESAKPNHAIRPKQ